MNKQQLAHATEEMINWLSHPAELGKAPSKIECAKEFDYNGLHYYIFRYKKSALGKWLLGVCGGYEGDEPQHCGHVFSEMEEYSEAKAEDMAKKLVDGVIACWKEQAERAEAEKEHAGTFVSFVLLEENAFDKEAYLKILKDEWGIEDDDPGEELNEGDDTVMISYKGAIASVALMPAPVPQEEIDYHAAGNYHWKDGKETVKRQKAHLVVMVMGKALPPVEAVKLFVKLLTACCSLKGVLGIYSNGTVYQPEFYSNCARIDLKDDKFPLMNAVWFGLYMGKNGVNGFTDGLRRLGYDEMEVIDSKQSANEVIGFLAEVTNYVVTSEVILRDGETIGFTAEQKLPITKSRGYAVDGESLKIGF